VPERETEREREKTNIIQTHFCLIMLDVSAYVSVCSEKELGRE